MLKFDNGGRGGGPRLRGGRGDCNFLPSPFHPSDMDLDIPISFRKGVRTCSRHPLSNFLPFHRLNPKYEAFTTHRPSNYVPKNVQEAKRP